EPAVCGDDVRRGEVVAREAKLAHRPADAATEREPGDAGGRNQTAGRGKPVRLGLVVDVGPDRAPANGRPAGRRIDTNAPHRREVDDDPFVDGRESRDAVTAAADSDR